MYRFVKNITDVAAQISQECEPTTAFLDRYAALGERIRMQITFLRQL